MLSKMGMLPTSGSTEGGSYGEELEEQIRVLLDEERRNDFNLIRSGSAPPSVERSFTDFSGGDQNHADGLIWVEDELRSHPDYRSYYFANVNLNPRLPPPLPFSRLLQGGNSARGGNGGGENSTIPGSGFQLQQSRNDDQNYLFPFQNDHHVRRNSPSANIYASPSVSPLMANRAASHVSETGFNYPDFLSAQMAALNVNGNRKFPHSPVSPNRDESFGNMLNNRSTPAELSLHFLEEFKVNSNQTNYFTLSQIAGHVVEFSIDQYGSRFIQQKLETATVEEKNMVLFELVPEALVLTTDVFGNYVVQKLIEVGMESHKRELVKLLSNHVLPLSLQMYGCRVMQKILEVVDLEQKVKLVKELDGHVMVCIRDQNGNHVIQKCIECIPVDYIGFIVTPFFGQVAHLSIHPYGCRVIQRILEHCRKPFIQTRMMDEILRAVKDLSQDQYGNYVIQYVVQYGKQHERSKIIHELVDIIVEMSQQKFASNVVEKCLKFGSPSEHRLLVKQMLGSTAENEPLQAMMKDQYGNYVVQMVLETSDRPLRNLVLSRIRVHFNSIRRYTYAKHIIARLEKLLQVAAGGRKAVQSPRLRLHNRG